MQTDRSEKTIKLQFTNYELAGELRAIIKSRLIAPKSPKGLMQFHTASCTIIQWPIIAIWGLVTRALIQLESSGFFSTATFLFFCKMIFKVEDCIRITYKSLDISSPALMKAICGNWLATFVQISISSRRVAFPQLGQRTDWTGNKFHFRICLL